MDEQLTVIQHEFDTDGAMTVDDATAYVGVISDAFEVHKDRERMRHGLWKQYKPEDQARQVKIKADRVENALDLLLDPERDGHDRLTRNAVEELYDIINYSVFAIRQLTGVEGSRAE